VVDASDHFRSYNYDCLSDQRANLIIGDARNHLLLTKRKYDVIISEPTNPWISGVGDLFTSEFFGMVRDRLKVGGIMCAWFHTYHMGDGDLKAIVRTFLSVFPEGVLWMADDTDLIFLGSAVPLAFDERLGGRMDEAAIAQDLARIWIHRPEDLVSSYVAGPRALLSFVGSAPGLNTDDNMLLEFSAGTKVLEETERIHLVSLLRLMEPPPLDRISRAVAEKTLIHMEARKTAARGSLELAADRTGTALALCGQAYQQAPTDPYVLNKYIETNLSVANVLFEEGRYDEAARHYQEALVEPDYPTSWLAYIGLGVCYLARRDPEKAYGYTRLSVEKNPRSADGYYNLGRIQHLRGNISEAIMWHERALDLLPHAGAANDLSRILLEGNTDFPRAAELAGLAVSLEEKPAFFNTLGWAYHSLRQYQHARRALKKGLDLEPKNSEALFRLGMVELSAGNAGEARSYFARAAELGRQDHYARQAEDMLRGLGQR
jgi:tetratricopeptide (TPR) repeat protein